MIGTWRIWRSYLRQNKVLMVYLYFGWLLTGMTLYIFLRTNTPSSEIIDKVQFTGLGGILYHAIFGGLLLRQTSLWPNANLAPGYKRAHFKAVCISTAWVITVPIILVLLAGEPWFFFFATALLYSFLGLWCAYRFAQLSVVLAFLWAGIELSDLSLSQIRPELLGTPLLVPAMITLLTLILFARFRTSYLHDRSLFLPVDRCLDQAADDRGDWRLRPGLAWIGEWVTRRMEARLTSAQKPGPAELMRFTLFNPGTHLMLGPLIATTALAIIAILIHFLRFPLFSFSQDVADLRVWKIIVTTLWGIPVCLLSGEFIQNRARLAWLWLASGHADRAHFFHAVVHAIVRMSLIQLGVLSLPIILLTIIHPYLGAGEMIFQFGIILGLYWITVATTVLYGLRLKEPMGWVFFLWLGLDLILFVQIFWMMIGPTVPLMGMVGFIIFLNLTGLVLLRHAKTRAEAMELDMKAG